MRIVRSQYREIIYWYTMLATVLLQYTWYDKSYCISTVVYESFKDLRGRNTVEPKINFSFFFLQTTSNIALSISSRFSTWSSASTVYLTSLSRWDSVSSKGTKKRLFATSIERHESNLHVLKRSSGVVQGTSTIVLPLDLTISFCVEQIFEDDKKSCIWILTKWILNATWISHFTVLVVNN